MIPVGDWQFWVVSIIVAAALIAVVRQHIPGLRSKKSTRVSLTINRDKDPSDTPRND